MICCNREKRKEEKEEGEKRKEEEQEGSERGKARDADGLSLHSGCEEGERGHGL